MPISQDDINNVYQTTLSRTATPAETSSFMQYANNGSVPLTQMDLQQIVQATPEYQSQQLQKYGQQYSTALGASDQRILGLSQNAVTQQFAGQGRNIGSSGYLSAYANAAANLAMSRQQQLASFYGQGYSNILSSGVTQGNAQQGNAIAQQNSTLGFNRQMQLYQQQQTDYQSWMNSQNRRGFGSGVGSMIAAGGGAYRGFLGGDSKNQNTTSPNTTSPGGGGGSGYTFNTNGSGYSSNLGGMSSADPGYTQGMGGESGVQFTNSSMADKSATDTGGISSGSSGIF